MTSDAPYLNYNAECNNGIGLSGEVIHRSLQLKGSYENGFHQLSDSATCAVLDSYNKRIVNQFLDSEWNGILVGNIDLLGPELLLMLSQFPCPILHHIGFMNPPFPINCLPQFDNYKMIAASMAVGNNLRSHGFPVPQAAVVYPGARTDLFGDGEQLMSSGLRFA